MANSLLDTKFKSQPRPAPSRLPVLAAAAAVVAAAAVHIGLGLKAIGRAAPTYDEPVHLAAGYSYLETGRYSLNIHDHPPLAEMWGALPLVYVRPTTFFSHPDWLEQRQYHYADVFLNQNRIPGQDLLDLGRRFDLVTWSVLVLAALALWAGRRWGPVAAGIGAAFLAFCPTLLAHETLVTTDAASASLFFVSIAALAASVETRWTTGWAVASGAACGLAMASKFNMVLLPPLLIVLLAVDARLRRDRHLSYVMLGAIVLLTSLLTLAAVYRFRLGLFWDGFSATWARLGGGRSSFFLGDHSTTGFLAYFPAALLVKTPLPELALGAAGFALCLRDLKRDPAGMWAILPPAVYFAAALTSKVQIGHRHILPLYPFLLLLAARGGAWLWVRGAAGVASVVVLLLLQAASVLPLREHPLTYFNALAGGPEGGYRWFTDSNLDWGQGLKPLAEELHRRGDPALYLSYFGCADPEAYGVRYVQVAPVSNVERSPAPVRPFESGRVLLAVSATNLQGTYYNDSKVFAWLLRREPAFVAGHSIFVYDLTDDAEGVLQLGRLLALAARRSGKGLADELGTAAEKERRSSFEERAAQDLVDWGRAKFGAGGARP